MTVLIVVMRMSEEEEHMGEAEERLKERERELALLPTPPHHVLKQVTCHGRTEIPPPTMTDHRAERA